MNAIALTDTVQIERARCSGWSGFKNGRKHLVDLDRLVNVRIEKRWTMKGELVTLYATGPCPVCGLGWLADGQREGPAGRVNHYDSVLVKGTYSPDTKCRAACLDSASAECKCSCGGANHGMQA